MTRAGECQGMQDRLTEIVLDIADAGPRLASAAASDRLPFCCGIIAADNVDGRDAALPGEISGSFPGGAGESDRSALRVQHAGGRDWHLGGGLRPHRIDRGNRIELVRIDAVHLHRRF